MFNTGTIFRTFIVITLLSVTLIGCSSGGDESASAPTNPTTSSNWDQMEWGKGTWSN